MSKLKFTEEELELLKRTVDIYDKSKLTVLGEFNNNYDWNFIIKEKWFDTVEHYNNAINARAYQDSLARNIVSKLNCISDSQWKKEIR